MASETQSFEMFIPDTMSKNYEKTVIYSKKKSLLLIAVIMAAIITLGIFLTPIYVQLNHLSLEQIVLTKKLTKIIVDNEEIKITEQILQKERIESKNSYAHFLKAGELGYFQVLEDKMSFFEGQAACKKIHGKIIECDERHGNASRKFFDVGIKFKLNRRWGKEFNVPFYIGLINIGANRDKNQWRWSSTGRSLSKNTLGNENTTIIPHRIPQLSYTKEWKLISWAKGANGLKLHGDCAFINNDAELKDIDCSTMLLCR